MNKLSKEKRERIISIALGAVVIAGALWYLVIGAQKKSLTEFREKILVVEERLRKADMIVRRSARIQADSQETGSKLGALEMNLIPFEALRGKKWLLDTLSDFIRTNDFEVTLISLPESAIVGQGAEFVMLPNFPYQAATYPNVVLKGTYHEFGKFIAGLENNFPFLSIQKLEIVPVTSVATGIGAPEEPNKPAPVVTDPELLNIAMTVCLLYRPTGSP